MIMMEHGVMDADKKDIAEAIDELIAKAQGIKAIEDKKDLKLEIRELEKLLLKLKKQAGMGSFDRAEYQKDLMFKKRQEKPGYGYGQPKKKE